MIIPRNIDFVRWWNSLIVDFPDDNIPFLVDENDWKEKGDALVREESFNGNGAPGTLLFNDKWQWAQAVFKAMANF